MHYRSAITGRFVTAKYAKRHPKTTVAIGSRRRRKAATRRINGHHL